LKTTAYTGYRKVEKADAKIAFNIDDDILMKVKENTYAVKSRLIMCENTCEIVVY